MSKIIKIGIDLGTTNSEIAVKKDQEIDLIKNIEGEIFTPSAFGIDKEGNKLVGRKAYQKIFREGKTKNYKSRVKRLMGSRTKFDFPRAEEDFGPEEISAEILKSLKTDVLRKYPDFDTVAAVITIPTYFNRLQAEATKRAGKRAGFEYVVLLQEPIAASMAYGFRQEKNENWLVYDLGGGTFDAALISSSGGSLSVLSHNGDNFLGGDDFDDLIVDEVIIPEIANKVNTDREEIDISDRERLILKGKAKEAKEQLSNSEQVTLEIEHVFHEGKEVVFRMDLKKDDFNSLIKPIVDKTIKISKKTIEDSGLDLKSVDSVVLVGGSTKISYIRQELRRELGVEVDSSENPITAVARGACIYGGSKKIPTDLIKKRGSNDNSYNLDLNYDSTTTEDEETIGGRIDSLQEEKDYFIQIKSEDGMYSGSKKKLKEDGTFLQTLSIEKNKTNKFLAYLYDDEGNSLNLSPNSFEITHGISSTGTPLPHSIGVAVAKDLVDEGEMKIGSRIDFLFEKGESLPLEETREYKTIRGVKKDSDKSGVDITVYEGESNIPDYNRFVCDVSITGKDVEHNLPEGEDVRVTIEINESSEIILEAYFPSIDLHIQKQEKLRTKYDKEVDVGQLEEEAGKQKQKYRELNEKLTKEDKEEVDGLIEEIDRDLKNSENKERLKKAEDRMRKLKQKMKEVEDRRDFSELVQEFNSSTQRIENLVRDLGNDSDLDKDELKEEMDRLKEKGKDAIDREDTDFLVQINNNLAHLHQKILNTSKAFWVYLLQMMIDKNINDFKNPAKAREIIRRGRSTTNLNELKSHVRELYQLLPINDQLEMDDSVPDITLK